MTPAELYDRIADLPEPTPLYIGRFPTHGSERDHWRRWLEQRATAPSAGWVYNHVQNRKMLLWLAEAVGVDRSVLVAAIERAVSTGNCPARCNDIRGMIPWSVIETKLRSNP